MGLLYFLICHIFLWDVLLFLLYSLILLKFLLASVFPNISQDFYIDHSSCLLVSLFHFLDILFFLLKRNILLFFLLLVGFYLNIYENTLLYMMVIFLPILG